MTKVAILGGSGYTAVELIKILLRHPHAEIAAVTSRQEGTPPLAEQCGSPDKEQRDDVEEVPVPHDRPAPEPDVERRRLEGEKHDAERGSKRSESTEEYMHRNLNVC